MNRSESQWQQLDMFRPAKDFKNTSNIDVEYEHMTDPSKDKNTIKKEHADYKVDAAKKSGLYESIKSDGVKKPVFIAHSKRFGEMVSDGGHRVAAATDINPNMLVPVEHSENVP
jgi:ParB-like nuclease domain